MKPVQAARAASINAPGELLSRAQGGDMSAFEALVEQLRDRVYAFGLMMTRSETEALEIAQESFLSAYLHLNEFRTEADFAEWVHLIAASHASLRLQLVRNGQAAEGRPQAPEPDADAALAQRPAADWSNELLERPLRPELLRAIGEAVDRLPQHEREVFLFKDVSGLSYEQIAHIRGESIAGVKSRLHQARLSLREAIDRSSRA